MLPKIKHPTFEFKVPSTGKLERFRPWLGSDERVLLMAKTSDDESYYLDACRQVVNNCAASDKFDADRLTGFDIEYLFVKIRSVTVSNVCEVSYIDNEDSKTYDFSIDLDKIEVTFPEEDLSTVKVDDAVAFTLKYPSARLFADPELAKLDGDAAFEYKLLRCVDKVFDGDEVADAQSEKPEDLAAFLDELPIGARTAARRFFDLAPKIVHSMDYTNAMGREKKIVLSTLSDFFTFR